ncbi:MAG: 2-succinyl-6-hydroxy-2,4-cyclohexadiene-1-carboxylate synthase [Bacteroidota bacterium]
MNLRVRGISYHFNVIQSRDELPYLVMLHGFLGSGNSFNHLIDSLTPFCNPVLIDLLGHGKTEGAELHYRFSVNEQVADVCKLIQEQLPHPVHLFGYSMGGRLALNIALQKPEIVHTLILESTTFGIEPEAERLSRQALDARRADQIMGNYAGFLKQWRELPLFNQVQISGDYRDTIHAIQHQQEPVWMANQLLGFGTGTMPAVRHKLNEIKNPVLLLTGERDRKFVTINQTMKRELPNSELVIVKESGHRIFAEQPGDWINGIRTFLTNQSWI